ncbi:MAG: ATP-binding cassette domain-containing protein [Polynucleobacter sp.]|nr:ATP-binding cassette domain-containing protein [Polynucleobacter sp.]
MNVLIEKITNQSKKLVRVILGSIKPAFAFLETVFLGLVEGLLVIGPLVFWGLINGLEKVSHFLSRIFSSIAPKLVSAFSKTNSAISTVGSDLKDFSSEVWGWLPKPIQVTMSTLGLLFEPIWRPLVWLIKMLAKLIGLIVNDVIGFVNYIAKLWNSFKEKLGLNRISFADRKQEVLKVYSAEAIHQRFSQSYEAAKLQKKKEFESFRVDLAEVIQRFKSKPSENKDHHLIAQLSPFAQERNMILVSSIIINILALAFPLLMLQLYDRILPRQSSDTLIVFAFGVGIAIAIESIVRVLRSAVTAWISARFEHRAYLAYANRLLAQPLHEFERKGTGAVMEDFKSISTLKYHYSGQTYQQMLDLPFTFLYVLIIFLISPWVGLLLIAGYSFFVFITWTKGQQDPVLIKEQKEADLRRANFLNEILKNVHTLKSMTMEALMLRRYERLQESSAKLMARVAYALDMSSGLGAIFSPIMTVLVLTLGAYLVITNHMSNGELAACVLLGMRALAPLQRLGGIWAKFQQDEVLRDKLAKSLNTDSLNPKDVDSAQDDNVAVEVDLKAAGLSMQNVSYQFPGSKVSLFNNLSLNIKPGECIAIGGKGGSGRSTLMQLMSGLISPATGEVLMDGVNVHSLPVDIASQRIAYLPQKAVMFEGSLLDNATVYDPSRVDNALRIANEMGLADFVSKMPRGWDSIVGDMSADSMPPGYRQRIAIVRALSSNPNIILFDDASSAMDSEGDALLLKFLESIRGKVTLVLVSERPSFLRMAERTLYLHNGTLLEAHSGGVAALREVMQSENAEDAQNAQAARLQLLPSSYQPMAPFDYFDSPFKTGRVLSNKWEHLHETVAGNFKQATDLSGCLSLLLKLMNSQDTAREVDESLPYFTDELDLTGFQNAMAQLDYKVAEVDCTLSEIDPRAMPCLFLPNEGSAFVILGRIGNQLRLGASPISEPYMESNLSMTGRAFFYEKSDFKLPEQRSWVAHTLYRFSSLIGQATISSLVSGVVIMSGSLFLMVVYSTIIPSGALDTLFYLAFGAFVALSLSYFFVVQRASILSYIAGRIEYLFGTAILQQVLKMPPSYTERASVGSQTARLQAFEGIRDLFTGPLASTLLEMPATLVLLVGLSIINPIALLLFAIMMTVYGILFFVFSQRTNDQVALVSRTSTKRTEFLIEMIGKMRFIRESGAQYLWLDRLRETSATATMASFQAEKLSSMLVGVSYFVMMLAALLIVGFTTPAVINQTLSSGALIASMMLMWRVLTPMQTAFVNMTRIERIRSASRQIDALMRIQGERQENAASPVARGIQGRIEFARVSFRYSLNVDPALIGVEFRVNPGELIALSGPNGGGKSTVLKLLLGMYQPQAGNILVDGVDIRQLDSQELRRLIGYAPQDMQFFRATIAQNLRLARPDATDDEVYQALDMAGALEAILALPNGINYRIGDNTNELPAGLKQKLLLARTYITRAPIMLFDEPGSGLDPEGDNKFIEALKAMKNSRTTVLFISHRPSHIRLANTLLVFDKGFLRAAGPPDELLKQPNAAA